MILRSLKPKFSHHRLPKHLKLKFWTSMRFRHLNTVVICIDNFMWKNKNRIDLMTNVTPFPLLLFLPRPWKHCDELPLNLLTSNICLADFLRIFYTKNFRENHLCSINTNESLKMKIKQRWKMWYVKVKHKKNS